MSDIDPTPPRPKSPSGEPKPVRPRDELGRPLPRGSQNRLHLADFDAFTLEENHRLAVAYFDGGNYFAAHEAWETCWVQAKDTAEQDFFQGLSQLGAGYTHLRRGNPRGAAALMRRALVRLAPYAPRHRNVDLAALAPAVEAHAEAMAAAAEAGAPPPAIIAPAIGGDD